MSLETARRARLAFSRDIRALVWSFSRGQCWYCGSHANPFEDFCIDHVLPLSRGGTNDIQNLVPSCRHCNAMKGAKRLNDWRCNFDRLRFDPLGDLEEEPWIHPSGVFWFERDAFFPDLRDDEIRYFERARGLAT